MAARAPLTGFGAGQDAGACVQRAHRAWPGGLGRYRPLRLLGRGGTSRVFLGEDRLSGQAVAIKLIGPPHPDAPGDRADGFEEAEIAASLVHPDIVRVLDWGRVGAGRFLVMESVAGGRTLRRHVRPGTQLPWPQLIGILSRLARAVAHLHGQGVLHLDIKPGNVLLARGRHPKLADFGNARRLGGERPSAAVRCLAGSPGYMAPEQMLGQALSRQTDVYALAAVTCQLLTGRPPPLDGHWPFERLAATVAAPAGGGCAAPPVQVWDLLRRSLAARRCERPADAGAFAEALAEAAGVPPVRPGHLAVDGTAAERARMRRQSARRGAVSRFYLS